MDGDEKKYLSLFNSFPFGMYIHDFEGKFICANPSFLKLLGYEKDEIYTLKFFELLSRDQIPKALKVIREIKENGSKYQIAEYKLKHKNGEYVDVETKTSVISTDGKNNAVLGILIDISERKKTEEKEQQFANHLRYLTNIAIAVVDLSIEDDIYLFIGKHLKKLVGDCIIFVNSFDEASNKFCIRSVLGVKKHVNIIIKLLGKHPLGMETPINNEAMHGLKSGKLQKVPGGLYVLSVGAVSKTICNKAEKMLGLSDIYAMGFSWGGKLYGSAAICLYKGVELENPSVIETYIRLASVALQRRRTEEAMRETNYELERHVKERTAELEKLNKELQIRIKEHERAANELSKSEAKYRSLVEEPGAGVATIDVKGKFTYVNNALCKMIGYSKKELIGKQFVRFLYPEDKEITLKIFQNMAKNPKKDLSLESRIMHKNGHIIYCYSKPTTFTYENKIIEFSAIITDITELKKAEEKLRCSEERFRVLFEYAPDGYYLNDLKGHFLDGNKAAEEIVGYKREELIGKNFLKIKLLPLNQIPKAAEALAKNILGKPTGPDEFVLNRKDGRQVTVEIRTFPVKIKKQRVVLGIARDIMERKRMENDLRDSKLKLQRKKIALERKNIALREVIEQIEREKINLKEDIATTVNELLSPTLSRLKLNLDDKAQKYANLLESQLKEITSSFGIKITNKTLGLTPREIEICNMVRSGLTSKEISDLLNISFRTVDKHRRNIRHKIGISKKRINLTSYLNKI